MSMSFNVFKKDNDTNGESYSSLKKYYLNPRVKRLNY